MKKNGFVFIETIVATVVLAAALLLLYTTFTKILQSEKTRVYYDNLSVVYRTWYIKTALNNTEFRQKVNDTSSYFEISDEDIEEFAIDTEFTNNLKSILNPSKLIVVKNSYLNTFKKENDYDIDLHNYIRSIFVEDTVNSILIAEYNINNKYYYSWVGV